MCVVLQCVVLCSIPPLLSCVLLSTPQCVVLWCAGVFLCSVFSVLLCCGHQGGHWYVTDRGDGGGDGGDGGGDGGGVCGDGRHVEMRSYFRIESITWIIYCC